MACGLGLYVVLRDWRLLGQPTASWRGWSAEALRGWGDYFRVALPSVVMVCVEWWTFQAIIVMSGLLEDAQLAVGIVGVVYYISSECRGTVVSSWEGCSVAAASPALPPAFVGGAFCCKENEHSSITTHARTHTISPLLLPTAAALVYSVISGVGLATSVCVSNALGAGQAKAARRTVAAALLLMLCLEAAAVAVVVGAHQHLPYLFTDVRVRTDAWEWEDECCNEHSRSVRLPCSSAIQVVVGCAGCNRGLSAAGAVQVVAEAAAGVLPILAVALPGDGCNACLQGLLRGESYNQLEATLTCQQWEGRQKLRKSAVHAKWDSSEGSLGLHSKAAAPKQLDACCEVYAHRTCVACQVSPKQARLPMSAGAGKQGLGAITNLALYWALGIPLAAWLAFKLQWGVAGLWWGLAAANNVQVSAALHALVDASALTNQTQLGNGMAFQLPLKLHTAIPRMAFGSPMQRPVDDNLAAAEIDGNAVAAGCSYAWHRTVPRLPRASRQGEPHAVAPVYHCTAAAG